jgi:nucleotide-binding universal stress UspA family protein
MYENILYPTDGSGGAEVALAHAKELAEMYDATVHVLTVIETPHVVGGMAGETGTGESQGMSSNPGGTGGGMASGPQSADEVQTEREEGARAVVAEAAESFGAVETVTSVKVGSPYENVIEYAEENDIDLIMMGTHGRTGLDRYLLGSVTEKVVRMSDVPVVTVRHESEE